MSYNPSTGVYSLPAIYLAIPGTVIIAAQHNTPLEDLATANNYARPVIAGGTGANTKIGAANSLEVVSFGSAQALTDPQSAEARSNINAAGLAVVNRFTKTQEWSKGADVASAATLTLGDDGNYFDITGTTTITAIASKSVGTVVTLQFDASLTLVHNGTSLILPGSANIITTANDTIQAISLGSGNWFLFNYQSRGGIITPWVAYTPTLTGFGTATSVSFRSRRVGGNLEVFGRFTSGTATAVEARVSIGFNGTDGNVTVNSFMNSNSWPVGQAAKNTNAAATFFMLATGGNAYLRIGLQNSGRDGLTAVTGDIANGTGVFAFSASVPIEGW